MWRLANVAFVALAVAVSGCTTGAGHFRRSAPPGDASSAALRSAEPRYAATDRPSDRSSRGSPRFGDFVRAREPQLQFCYGEARRKHPNLTGSATVTVTLGDDGGVASTAIVRRSWAGKGGNDVERCLLSTVRGWRFPPVDPQDAHVHSFAVIFSR